jgi:hypothetical protein
LAQYHDRQSHHCKRNWANLGKAEDVVEIRP